VMVLLAWPVMVAILGRPALVPMNLPVQVKGDYVGRGSRWFSTRISYNQL
jgi:hypothetical protein